MAIPDSKDEVGATSTAFRDVLFLTLSCFVIIIILLLPHIAVDQDKKKDEDPPGVMIVEISWPPSTWTDIDLWVVSPNDKRPVGYSNQDDAGFNLLRDDLGTKFDPMPENYENAYTRGLADGEYIINVHAYSDKDKALPFDVNCVVRTKTGHTEIIGRKTVRLTHIGQEITVFRFTLKDQNLVGEIHSVPISLRKKINIGMTTGSNPNEDWQ